MKALPTSRLFRNILAVATGTAAAQAVALVLSPLITRIYTPEIFGLQGIFLSLMSILSPVIALRYPMAIITAKTDSEGLLIGRLSLKIAATLAGVLWLALAVGGHSLTHLLGAQSLGALIFFLPLALFCSALQDVMDFQAARQGKFRLTGIVEIFLALIVNSSRILGGLIVPTAATLITVNTLAPAAKVAMYRIGSPELHHSMPRQTFAESVGLLDRYREFPIYRMPTDAMSALSQSVPTLLLAALFTPAAAGLYVMARSVINLPLNVLQSAIGNVLYARFAEMHRQGEALYPLVFKTTVLQFLLPGGALFVISLAFPYLFANLFGENWRLSGEFAQWMSLWIICMLANIPSVRALPVIRCQGWHLIFNLIILMGGVIGMFVGYYVRRTALGSVIYFSIISALIYMTQIIAYLRIIKVKDRKECALG